MTKIEHLELLEEMYPMPQLTGPEWYYWIRFDWLSRYRVLFAVSLLINIAMIGVTAEHCSHGDLTSAYRYASTAVTSNLFVAALMRHEHFVNLLFRSAIRLSLRAPLIIRKHAAKIYSYGGIHSGCGTAALLWYGPFIAVAFEKFAHLGWITLALKITVAVFTFDLVVLVAGSHPLIRSCFHDWWEISHRYAGWTAIGVAWIQIFVLVIAESKKAKITSSSGESYSPGYTVPCGSMICIVPGHVIPPVAHTHHWVPLLMRTPSFWILLGLSCIIIYPWLRTRKRSFDVEQLSNHAVRLQFRHGKAPVGGAVRLGDLPVVGTHAFATIPNPDGSSGYSVIISDAGDWTKKFIQDCDRPKRLWMRGTPTLGVLHVALLFEPIVIVATGSGIGPCLSFLQMHRSRAIRVVWSARSPMATYGPRIIEAVLKTDKDAIMVDTKITGHPNLPAIVYSQYKQFSAEAILIISNQNVTRQVVFNMEARKVPAFGAIFDS